MTTTIKTKFLSFSFIFATFFAVYEVAASDVFIETDMEFGRGMLRAVGDECFIYTPKHVVEDTDDIFVSTRHNKDVEASLITSYPQDLALLQLPNDYRKLCLESTWTEDGGSRVRTIIQSLKKATLSFRKKNGSIVDYDLRIVEKDLHTYFYIELENSKKSLKKGMSGSTVYVANYPIGMLVSVADGVGRVLRIDTIANLSQSVLAEFDESGTKKTSNTKKSANASSNRPKGRSINNVSSSNNTQVFKGKLSSGETISFPIHTVGNTAFRVTMPKQAGRTRYSIGLNNPAGNKITSYGVDFTDKTHVYGFGTSDEGEHTLWISGSGGVGSFEIKLEEVATTEQLVGDANVLAHGDKVKGYIAIDTFASYKVHTKGNTAFRVTMPKQAGRTRYSIGLNNPAGKKIKSYGVDFTDKTHVYGFSTRGEGEHTLWISGSGGVGSFEIKLEEVAITE